MGEQVLGKNIGVIRNQFAMALTPGDTDGEMTGPNCGIAVWVGRVYHFFGFDVVENIGH